MHLAGLRACRQAAPQGFHRRAVLQKPGRDVRAVRGHPGSPRERRRDRATLFAHRPAGQELPAAVPHARWHDARRLPDRGGEARPGRAAGRALSEHGRSRSAASALRGPPQVRNRHHHPDGFPGLLPDRRGLHHLGQGKRRAGGAGAGLGRGLAGGLFAAHHRPRSTGLRPAVRTLPEPRAGVDARLRHRLLPGQPLQGHRIRAPALRRRRGESDRHFRHHGLKGGGAGCRQGAGPAVRPVRSALQADPGGAEQAARPHRGARAGAADRRDDGRPG